MRLASFIVLSAAAHAAALAYPVSFVERRTEQTISVVLLGEKGKGGAGLERGNVKKKTGQENGAPAIRQHYARAQKAEEQSPLATNRIEGPIGESNQVVRITPVPFGEEALLVGVRGVEGEKGASAIGVPGRGVGVGPTGNGDSGAGSGSAGAGSEDGSGGPELRRASYAYNPRPAYPEAARREGYEGTVVLRVLVGRDGRSKSIEVNRSSGFETLDSSAIESVKVWRFHPARHGKMPVESWIKIPIVFRLADVKN